MLQLTNQNKVFQRAV